MRLNGYRNGSRGNSFDDPQDEGEFVNANGSVSSLSSRSMTDNNPNHPHHHNSNNRMMLALEMEVEEEEDETNEQESLMEEILAEHSQALPNNNKKKTSRAASLVQLRKAAAARRKAANAAAASKPHQRVLGFLRDHVGHHFTFRNIGLLMIVTGLAVLFVEKDAELESQYYLPEQVLSKFPHQSSFFSDPLVKSNVMGEVVPSIANENWLNDVGFYWHHPFLSPFASELYLGLNSTLRARLQLDFEQRRKATIAQFGMWVQTSNEKLAVQQQQQVAFPKVNWTLYPYRDVPLSNFKTSAWQVNAEYLKGFLSQGLQLVQRVQNGIYVEYGQRDLLTNTTPTMTTQSPVSKANSSTTNKRKEKLQRKRQQLFGVTLVGNESDFPKVTREQQGVAVLTLHAWEALIRKLWHALLTHDTFFVVTVDGSGGGGGGGATASGKSRVNFVRSGPMQFHYLLEPVLDMLGVRLITRNMGCGDGGGGVYGTAASMNGGGSSFRPTISALGGGDVFGEADLIVVYNEHLLSAGEKELLYRQAILSGERVPIILGSSFLENHIDYSSSSASSSSPSASASDLLLPEAWVGRILSGWQVCPKVIFRPEDGSLILPESTPPACQYLNCVEDAHWSGKCNIYNNVCWVPRTDFTPTTLQETRTGDGAEGASSFDSSDDEASILLNDRQHQWEGRKLALLMLQALNETLDRWTKEVREGSTVLVDDLWHVGNVYSKLREQVRTHRNRVSTGGSGTSSDVDSVDITPTPCEELLAAVDPMICHMDMHVLTEWTPRVDPRTNGLKIQIISEYYDPNKDVEELYRGHDLLPLHWRIRGNEVDVHMIAIATNESLEQFTQQVSGETDNDDEEREDDGGRSRNSRRSLRDNRSLSPVSPSSFVSRSVEKSSNSNPNDSQQWYWYNVPIGFCDGSSQSTCNRRDGNTCLLANRNFYNAGIVGHGKSGWLHISVPAVSEGVILLRFDWAIDIMEMNGAKEGGDTKPSNRNRLEELPGDFVFQFSIGSGTITSISRSEFLDFGVKIVDDLIVYPVFMNRDMSYNNSAPDKQVDIGINIQSSTGPLFKVILTHVYYA